MTNLTLESRVTRLERQNRLLKAAGILAVAAFTAVVCMGQVGVPKVVEAEEFVLRDAEGATRGQFVLDADGPRLRLLDEKGEGRAWLGVSDDGKPSLMFRDEQGQSCVLLAVSVQDRPFLALLDEKARSRAALSLQADGPCLRFFDEKREVLWKAP